MAVFSQRVFHHRGKRDHFSGSGDNLLADRIVRIIRIDQGDKVRGNIHPEQVRGRQGLALAGGKMDDFIEFLNRIDPVA